MSTQFIACKAKDCPYNAENQCRSSSIVVGNDGRCLGKIKEGGQKSPTETYVELVECRNESCIYWEERVYREGGVVKRQGQCGLVEDLYFRYRSADSFDGPFCNSHEKQITEPTFRAVL